MTTRVVRPDEWEGEPHTLIVHSVTRLRQCHRMDDGELDYDLEHPSSCTEEESVYGDGITVMDWTCDVAQCERDTGLPFALRYSGTPVTEPGTYTIRSWHRRHYVYDFGTYEYDGGVGITERQAANEH